MPFKLFGRKFAGSRKSAYCRLVAERLEDRVLLAVTKTDIVFLYDESGSGQDLLVKDWVRAAIPALQTSLALSNIDATYGLIGFGETDRFAHSQIVNTSVGVTNPAALFGSAGQLDQAMVNLRNVGGDEDGWDAIDHALAEYNFRDGAVVNVVLVQNDEGRANFNRALTRDAVLAALKSKNVVFNALVVGEEIGSTGIHVPLFDLAPYESTPGAFTDRWVVGVDADATDSSADGQHDYYLIQSGTVQSVAPDATKPATQAEALQVSFNGSNTGPSGMVGTGKSVLIGQNISGGSGRDGRMLALAA